MFESYMSAFLCVMHRIEFIRRRDHIGVIMRQGYTGRNAVWRNLSDISAMMSVGNLFGLNADTVSVLVLCGGPMNMR